MDLDVYLDRGTRSGLLVVTVPGYRALGASPGATFEILLTGWFCQLGVSRGICGSIVL